MTPTCARIVQKPQAIENRAKKVANRPVLATNFIRLSFCKSQQEFRQPIDLSIHCDVLSDSVW